MKPIDRKSLLALLTLQAVTVDEQPDSLSWTVFDPLVTTKPIKQVRVECGPTSLPPYIVTIHDPGVRDHRRLGQLVADDKGIIALRSTDGTTERVNGA